MSPRGVRLVREERERQPVLLPELHVLLGLVRAHTEDDRALALELAPDVADPARLRCASGRVVFRVKIQYDRRPRREESVTRRSESLGSVKSGAGVLPRPQAPPSVPSGSCASLASVIATGSSSSPRPISASVYAQSVSRTGWRSWMSRGARRVRRRSARAALGARERRAHDEPQSALVLACQLPSARRRAFR